MGPTLGIKWGMIGVGSVAEHKSGPAFLQAEGGSLVAVAARRPDQAAAYAERHDVPHVFATPSELIASDLVDAVYIATPPASHAPLALEVARAGKPCCVEKPMAVYLRDAEELCRVFDDANLSLFVSYYRRTLPRFEKVAQVIADGTIGPVRSVEWRLGRTATPPGANGNWRLDPAEAPGGLFEDLACHGLDLLDHWLGSITQIDSARFHFHDGQPVPGWIEATWQHGPDISGHAVWDFAADGQIDDVVVTGASGTVRCSIFDEAPVEVRVGDNSESFEIPNPTPIQLPHVVALNHALNNGAPHPSTGASALRTAWASEEILRGPNTRTETEAPVRLEPRCS